MEKVDMIKNGVIKKVPKYSVKDYIAAGWKTIKNDTYKSQK
jgi:hypothetical protein|nr:MAG TPA: hypothetical protein [Caudoviricetes sp.]